MRDGLDMDGMDVQYEESCKLCVEPWSISVHQQMSTVASKIELQLFSSLNRTVLLNVDLQ